MGAEKSSIKTIMKTRYIKTIFTGSLILGLALAITGCASSGYRRGQQVGAALQADASRVEQHSASLDLAVSTLNDLVNNPQADLRPQFKRFSSALGKPGLLADSIRKADQDMQTRGEVYFADWDKELATIQNDSIRSRGQARKLEVLSQYNGVRNSCLEAQKQISPLESDLWDVHRFLNADLTPGGLTAIKDATARVNQLASPVHDSVKRLVGDMRSLGLAMSPLHMAQ